MLTSSYDVHLGSSDRLRSVRLVRKPEPRLGVDLGLVGRIGVAQNREQVSLSVHDRGNLAPAHALLWRGLAGLNPESGTFGLGLGDPAGDARGIGSGVESCPVLGELPVTRDQPKRSCRSPASTRARWAPSGNACDQAAYGSTTGASRLTSRTFPAPPATEGRLPDLVSSGRSWAR